MDIFQYGLEIEYTPLESHRLVDHYHPVERDHDETRNWTMWSAKQRHEWLMSKLASLPYGDRSVVMEREEEQAHNWLRNLPKNLHRDDSGNAEFTLPPSSFAELQLELENVFATVGPGSVQITLSLSFADFFGPPAQCEERCAELLGWFNFHHQLDPMERLWRNGQDAQKNPERPVGRFLEHPFLGPMVAQRHRLLRKTLRENARGRMWDRESLALVIRREHSFKYVGSTIYRPDLAGPERICLEIRDGHKNPEILFARVERIRHDFPRRLSPFIAFAKVPPFDSMAAFHCFSTEIKQLLYVVFQRTMPDAVMALAKPRFAHETFRNWAWPLAGWETWLKALERADLLPRLALAREVYLRELTDLAAQVPATAAATTTARLQIGQALLRFINNSSLLMVFRDQRRRFDT